MNSYTLHFILLLYLSCSAEIRNQLFVQSSSLKSSSLSENHYEDNKCKHTFLCQESMYIVNGVKHIWKILKSPKNKYLSVNIYQNVYLSHVEYVIPGEVFQSYSSGTNSKVKSAPRILGGTINLHYDQSCIFREN